MSTVQHPVTPGAPDHLPDVMRDPMSWPSETKTYIVDLVQVAGIEVPASNIKGLYTTGSSIGALGSPIHGKPTMVRVGSSPYEFVQMTYDEVYGKWVSTSTYQGFMIATGVTSASPTYADVSTTYFPQIVIPQFLAAYNAGLRPQCAMGGYINADLSGGSGSCYGEVQMALYEFNNADTTTPTVIATGGSLQSAADSNTSPASVSSYCSSNWTDFTFSATPADTSVIFRPQIRRISPSGPGTMTLNSFNVLIRYVADPA